MNLSAAQLFIAATNQFYSYNDSMVRNLTNTIVVSEQYLEIASSRVHINFMKYSFVCSKTFCIIFFFQKQTPSALRKGMSDCSLQQLCSFSVQNQKLSALNYLQPKNQEDKTAAHQCLVTHIFPWGQMKVRNSYQTWEEALRMEVVNWISLWKRNLISWLILETHVNIGRRSVWNKSELALKNIHDFAAFSPSGVNCFFSQHPLLSQALISAFSL